MSSVLTMNRVRRALLVVPLGRKLAPFPYPCLRHEPHPHMPRHPFDTTVPPTVSHCSSSFLYSTASKMKSKDKERENQKEKEKRRGPSHSPPRNRQPSAPPGRAHLENNEKNVGLRTSTKNQNGSRRSVSSNDQERERKASKPSSSDRSVTSNEWERGRKASRPSRSDRSVTSDERERKPNKPPSSDSMGNLDSMIDVKRKKGKRVMRLDPTDNSSKRFQDDGSLSAALDIDKEENSGLSHNAEFRSVQPSSALLHHIEKYFLGRRRVSEWHRAGYAVKIGAPLDNLPHNEERAPIKEEVFRHKLKFAAAASVASSFPLADLPEVAFAGRSNVGKSSLINALTRQWGVARISDKPGLTQTINFFRLGGRLCFVDLPGYGFAFANDDKKKGWNELVKEYVSAREGLRRVCILVDAKWGMKLHDEEFIALLESSRTRYQVVLTKTDCISPIDLARRVTKLQEDLKDKSFLVQPMLMVSSRTGAGLELFRAQLAKIARSTETVV